GTIPATASVATDRPWRRRERQPADIADQPLKHSSPTCGLQGASLNGSPARSCRLPRPSCLPIAKHWLSRQCLEQSSLCFHRDGVQLRPNLSSLSTPQSD